MTGSYPGDTRAGDVHVPIRDRNRRQSRLAVVSTARMERGCLGLFAASEHRQAARLRKMIGKNVGALYFGLPLSSDPRSLMYAYIGGPQELDRMSEVF
jgi:hypothetical protein